MKGLILKDLYILRNYTKSFLMVLVILAAISIAIGNTLTYIPIFVSILMIIPVASVFNYDATVNWNEYAFALPISRKVMVGSKYVELVAIFIILYVISLATSIVEAFSDAGVYYSVTSHVTLSALLPCLYLVVMLVWIPLIFKFGIEKSRIILIILGAAMGVGLSILSESLNLGRLTFIYNSPFLSVIIPLAVISFFTISYLTSVRVMEKKEV